MRSPERPRLATRRALRLVTVAAAACLPLLSSVAGVADASAHAAAPAARSGGPGCQTVHAGPKPAADGSSASYFRLTLSPGGAGRETVLLANPEPYPCSVTLDPASGETAVNSGDTYPVPAHGCSETSCWVTGLPATVQVPAHARVDVSFGVSVPSGVPGGEYLAGVVIRPTDPPTPPSPGRDKQVAIAVASRVALGVAVIVPGPLRPRLAISSVTLDVSQGSPTLYVRVRDLGNTWEHPAGGALIDVAGVRRSFGIRASTILAGDVALLPLPIPGVARGRWPTEIDVHYGHRQVAVWRGTLSYPTPRTAGSTGSGMNVAGERALPTGHLPGWVLGIIAALGLLVVLLLFFVFLLFRRRRDDAMKTAHDRATGVAIVGRVLTDAPRR